MIQAALWQQRQCTKTVQLPLQPFWASNVTGEAAVWRKMERNILDFFKKFLGGMNKDFLFYVMTFYSFENGFAVYVLIFYVVLIHFYDRTFCYCGATCF